MRSKRLFALALLPFSHSGLSQGAVEPKLCGQAPGLYYQQRATLNSLRSGDSIDSLAIETFQTHGVDLTDPEEKDLFLSILENAETEVDCRIVDYASMLMVGPVPE